MQIGEQKPVVLHHRDALDDRSLHCVVEWFANRRDVDVVDQSRPPANAKARRATSRAPERIDRTEGQPVYGKQLIADAQITVVGDRPFQNAAYEPSSFDSLRDDPDVINALTRRSVSERTAQMPIVPVLVGVVGEV